jgi:hypothetical protein
MQVVFWQIIIAFIADCTQRYTYRVIQTIQMNLIPFSVWADRAVLGCAKTPLKFKYEILIGKQIYNSMYGACYKFEK